MEMEMPSQTIEHQMIVVQGSPPRSPSHRSSSKVLPLENVDVNSSAKNYFHIPTNLNQCGSAPVLPMSILMPHAHAKKNITSNRIHSLSPLKKKVVPEAEKSIELLLSHEYGGKYLYNSQAFVQSIANVKNEYEQSSSALKNRLAAVDKLRSIALKEHQKVERQLISKNQEVFHLKNQVGVLNDKVSQQDKMILSQKQDFVKVTQRCSSINEALQTLAKDDDEQGKGPIRSKEGGKKAALLSLAKENQECQRKIKLLQAGRKSDTKKLNAAYRHVTQLKDDLKEANILVIANSVTTLPIDCKKTKVDETETHHFESYQFIDEKVIRVLGAVDSNYDISRAVDLSMKLKQWYTFMPSLCTSCSSVLIMERLMEFIKKAMNCHDIRLYVVDEVQKKLIPFPATEERNKSRGLALDKGITGHVVKHKRPYLRKNPHEDPRFFNASDASMHKKVHDILCFPIQRISQQVIAVVEVTNTIHKKGFSKNDEALMSVISVQIGTLLLAEEANQKQSTLQNLAYEIMQLPHRILPDAQPNPEKPANIKYLIRRFEKETIRILGVRHVQIYVLSGSFLWYLIEEMDEDCNAQIVKKNTSITSGLCGDMISSGTASRAIATPHEEVVYNDTVDLETGTLGMYIVPIISLNGNVLGVMETTRTWQSSSHEIEEHRKVAIDSASIELLTLLAHQLASLLHYALPTSLQKLTPSSPKSGKRNQ